MSDPSRLRAFLSELRRRRVVRAAVVYAVVAWAVVEIADTVFPRLGLPEWSVTLLIAFTLAGFPICLVLAWAFELTPRGVLRTERAEATPTAGSPVAEPTRTVRIAGYALAGVLGMALGVVALGVLSGRAGSPGRDWTSIAVLPFADMSRGGEQAHLGDGIAEEITHALAGIDGLRVAARTSAFRFRQGGEDIREIGDQLGVEAVLEGSVRRNDRILRVTVQLVDAEEGFEIWSATYDRDFDDVFRVQEDIARSVVDALGLTLPGQGRIELVEAPTAEPEAYDLYLRGRRSWEGMSTDAHREAIPYFERALAIDSTMAPAYVGLADAYIWLGYWTDAFTEAEWSRRADSLLNRALELDPTLGEAYATRAGAILYSTGGRAWREAEALNRTAAALSPRYPIAHAWLAWVRLEGRGDVDGALAAGARAYELDPNSWPVVRNFGRALLFSGRVDEAIGNLEEAEPVLGPRWELRSRFYSAAGRHAEAGEAALRLTEEFPASSRAWLMLAAVRAAGDDDAGSRAALNRALVSDPTPWRVGVVYGALGDMDEAYRWLDRGGWTLWDRADLQYDPLYDPVRAHPRWTSLFERIKKELDVEG